MLSYILAIPKATHPTFISCNLVQQLAALNLRYYSRIGKSQTTLNEKKSDQFVYFNSDHLSETRHVPEHWPEVPLVATDKLVIFPRFTKTLELTDIREMNSVRHQIANHQPYLGVFLKKNPSQPLVTDTKDLHEIGSFVHVREVNDFNDRVSIVVNAARRIKLEKLIGQNNTVPIHLLPSAPMLKVTNFLAVDFLQTEEVKAITQEIVKTFRDIVSVNPLSADVLQQILQENQYVIRDTVYLCDLAASITSATPEQLQNVMGEQAIPKRLMITLAMLKRELEESALQKMIGKEVEDNVKKMHRRFMLQEQAKVIKKELGIEKDDRTAVADRFKLRLVNKSVPTAVQKVIDEELKKIRSIEGHSADFNLVRNYLDWLTILPWGMQNVDNLNLDKARKSLDEDHFGMEEIKTRVLEFIAVSQLKGSTQGKILCFHGPPGVGKTSIVRSIAKALDRKYFRFSVGGMSNAAEVKGHRRTYVGAMPGKMVQCLKSTKTENPLVLIDEIDKIGRAMGTDSAGFGGGDPSAALLEMLDPEQNASFMDFFLDVPVDLSKILFICTANVADAIPAVLADRMELIEMSGYVEEEKISIAELYLIPKALAESGLTEKNIRFKTSALHILIQKYCSETGVRNLQLLIEKIIRKVAFQVAKKKLPAQIVINDLNVRQYLGRTRNYMERIYKTTPPGVVMGLGYTSFGGTAVYVETTKLASEFPHSRQVQAIHLTGNLGTVMKESAEIAMTVARNHMHDRRFLDQHRVHLHVPKASQPKDGPSAGVTIVAALQSLALGRPVRQDLAMTGEISLNGKVLPVGGIKEKAIAAKRLGVKTIILPAENRKDYTALPSYIRDGLVVHFVSNYEEVSKLIFE